MLTFCFLFFCFVYLVSPSLPPSWIVLCFFARRGRFPLRLYWSPPNATPQTPHTGAIKHWSLEKTTHKHTHTHKHLCYYTSRARSLPLVQTSSTEMLSTPQVLLGVLHLSELSKVFKPLWYETTNTDHHEFLIHKEHTIYILYYLNLLMYSIYVTCFLLLLVINLEFKPLSVSLFGWLTASRTLRFYASWRFISLSTEFIFPFHD